MTSIQHDTKATRESWLHAAIEIYRARFVEVGYPLPEKIHVSVGFGYGAREESKYTRAQCWKACASADNVNHIFISPMIGDTSQVLLSLLHECIHAALDCEDGHKGRFAEIATRLGFEGKMTSSQAGMELGAELMVLAAELGEYPHGQLEPEMSRVQVPVDPTGAETPRTTLRYHTGPATQTTRYHKAQCPQDGYSVRITAKWAALGLPTCPCGTQLELI